MRKNIVVGCLKKYILMMTMSCLAFAMSGCARNRAGQPVVPQDVSTEQMPTEEGISTQETAESSADTSCYVEMKAENQWDAGGGMTGAQCDFVIYNNLEKEVTDWRLELSVSENFRVDSLWNGEYTVKEGKLVITSVDYNSTIAAGSSIPVGFVMCADEVPKQTDVTLYIDGNPCSGTATQSTEDKTEENTQAPTSEQVTEKTPLERYGKLSVQGTKLVDQNQKPVQLTGVSTHGLAWFPQYVNREAFAALRDTYGVNVVRVAMYTEENGGYCTDGDQKQLEEKIDEAVRAANQLGMYVIIDWHVLHDLTPEKYKAQAKDFFESMAKKYAGYPNVIYEICNEPNGGTQWSQVKAYAEEVIPVIRRHAKDAIIIIGTPNWCQDADVAAKDPVEGYDNLLYAVHFYAAEHKEALRTKTETAIKEGLPVIISEFSICDASGNGAIDYASAEAWMDLADRYQLSFIGWSLSNKAETASLLRTDCNKTAGFTDEDLSETGKWLMQEIKKRH